MKDIDLVLVDFDDTLVATAPRFERARDELFRILVEHGFEDEAARTLHHDVIDPDMRARYGFGPRRLSHAFRHTYERLCTECERTAEAETLAELDRLGQSVLGTPPAIEGALAALQRLARHHPTVIYTQSGDRDYQRECVRAAGVTGLLSDERVYVCAHKTADAFREVLEHFGIQDPARTWMIGNSIRSDINPALEVGANAILVEVENPWVYDVVEPVRNGFPRVATFREAVDLLLNQDPS